MDRNLEATMSLILSGVTAILERNNIDSQKIPWSLDFILQTLKYQ